MAWGTSQYPDVGGRREGHGALEPATVPYEKNLVSKISGISSSKILSLLTVVLRRQDSQRARWDIVSVSDAKSSTVTGIVKYMPHDGAHSSGAGSPIKAFHANRRSLGRLNKIGKRVRDARRGTSINQDVERI